MTTMTASHLVSRWSGALWSGALGICAIVAVIRPAEDDVARGQADQRLGGRKQRVGSLARRSLDLLDCEIGADRDQPRRKSRAAGDLSQRGAQPAQGRRLDRPSGKLDGAA